MIDSQILNRKGARTTAGVPTEVLILLNQGKIETVNLCEWLVVDQGQLVQVLWSEKKWKALGLRLLGDKSVLEGKTAPKKIEAIARMISEQISDLKKLKEIVGLLLLHPSDLVRGWGCYVIGAHSALKLKERFEWIHPFATDRNMSVREVAWMALRESVTHDLDGAIKILSRFSTHADPNIRRFASEITRPRGVWARHIPELKEQPERALKILSPLKSDPSRYVQNSVANWLNDASKSKPQWVRQICQQWRRESPTPETAYLVKRALRSLDPTDQIGG